MSDPIPSSMDEPLARLADVAAGYPALRLLVLHGSRTRGDHHGRSDWDLAYLADASLDPLALLADVTRSLRTNHVDLPISVVRRRCCGTRRPATAAWSSNATQTPSRTSRSPRRSIGVTSSRLCAKPSVSFGHPRIVSGIELTVLAERAAAVERHLRRVEAVLPKHSDALLPATEASDAVMLHLWRVRRRRPSRCRRSPPARWTRRTSGRSRRRR
ncbi:MAG: nucleotidyltransferase domain-containing protein [Egibacteraceae bacterium]